MNLKVRGRNHLLPNLGRILGFTAEDYENHKNSRPGSWFSRQDINLGFLDYTA